jgi:hypothetical protein
VQVCWADGAAIVEMMMMMMVVQVGLQLTIATCFS